MWRILIKTILVVLLSTVYILNGDTGSFAAQCLVGDGGVFQKWWTVKDLENCHADEATEEFWGTVYGLRLNSEATDCPVEPDGDWNIFLKPDDNDKWILKNSYGVVNMNDLGQLCGVTAPDLGSESNLIEIELKTTRPPNGVDLRDYFKPGDRVLAKGYWVMDSGHAFKTELHPIISMRGFNTYGETETIFVAQDKSQRFTPSAYPIYEDFDFYLRVEDMSQSSGHINYLTRGDRGGEFILGTVLDEEGYLDQLHEISSTTESFRSSAPVSFYDTHRFTIWTKLNMAVPKIKPFYLGRLTKRKAAVLKEQIAYKVMGTEPNRYIKVEIAATALPRGPEPIRYSFWEYEANSMDGSKQLYRAENPIDHSVSFNLFYWPAEGYNATDWHLSLIGSTRPSGWDPSDEDAKIGPNAFTRSFIHDERVYKIRPSSMNLSSTAYKYLVDLGDDQENCDAGFNVNLEEDIIAGLSLRELKWQVSQIKYDPLEPGSVYEIIKDIPDSGPSKGRIGVPYASIEVDETNPKRVTVSFKSSGWKKAPAVGIEDIFGGPEEWPSLCEEWEPNNKTRLRIIAKGETEPGEKLVAATEDLYLHNCFSCPEHLIQEDVRKNFEKLIAAAIWFEEHKEEIPHGPPIPPFSDSEIKIITKGNPGGLLPLGDHEHTMRRIPKNYREIYKIYNAYTLGGKLTGKQSALMKKIIKTADKLPDFKEVDYSKIKPIIMTPRSDKFDSIRFRPPSMMHLPSGP